MVGTRTSTRRICECVVALAVLVGCAAPGGKVGRPLAAPYLHPTAQLTFPERIADLQVVDVQEFDPLDVAANYQARDVLLTVYIYPSSMLPNSSLEAHFQQALLAVQHQWGTETATPINFDSTGYDPRLPALAATFEMERAPRPIGVIAVHEACTHIVKFRLSSDRAVSEKRRFDLLDAALDAVVPRDFAVKALQSFLGAACKIEFVETSTDPTHVSTDGCTVFGNPATGPQAVQKVMCDALDARVAAQSR